MCEKKITKQEALACYEAFMNGQLNEEQIVWAIHEMRKQKEKEYVKTN